MHLLQVNYNIHKAVKNKNQFAPNPEYRRTQCKVK